MKQKYLFLVDGCKKTSIVFEDLVSSVEVINCQSVQIQVGNAVLMSDFIY